MSAVSGEGDNLGCFLRRGLVDPGYGFSLYDGSSRAGMRQRAADPEQSGRLINWSQFCADVRGFRDKSLFQEAKRNFGAFKSRVRQVIGTANDNELAQASFAFYKGIVLTKDASQSKKQKVKRELENYVGRISDEDFAQIQDLALSLSSWRIKMGVEEIPPIQNTQETRPFALKLDENLLDSTRILAPISAQNLVLEEFANLKEILDNISDEKIQDASIDEEIDYKKLLECCNGSHEIASACLNVLRKAINDAQLQNELFQLLGEENIEHVFFIFQHRENLIRLAKSEDMYNESISSSEKVPSFGTGITIESDMEKNLRKQKRKFEKKLLRKNMKGNDTDALYLSNQMDQSMKAMEDSIAKLPLKLELKRKDALPVNAVRKKFEKYEEVTIPAISKFVSEVDSLIKVSDAFDDYGKVAFSGIVKLNALQSKCYNVAYHSNENMLVCAPTGAGKTNVALMTILNELRQHVSDGVLQKDQFKIIYVAPMKALAQEVTEKFSKRLGSLGISVRELTGDMQLSKKEIESTQIIVTTPEKWDVVTRKSTSGADGSLVTSVRLLIIDEVHLLHEDRGAVIEALVARTIRQVEASQTMIRIVGLSATLPNYQDVALFLKVNPQTGLLVFDASHRPVPLEQVFIGVSESNSVKRLQVMNHVCFSKVSKSIRSGHQVMVFVHSRKDTAKTGEMLIEKAREENMINGFLGAEFGEDLYKLRNQPKSKGKTGGISETAFERARQKIMKSNNRDLRALFDFGVGIHHAGMVRSDRLLVEQLFSDGILKVLCCTATLAWGVNLPAHTVVIKGTQIYDTKRGGWVDLGMLDVMQIFGRAGRPQFDTSGEGIIITSSEKLPRYLSLLSHQLPIESEFITALPDNLNAEVILGTVTNLNEALAWLSYTYLYIRLLRNPTRYGVPYTEMTLDSTLLGYRKQVLLAAARKLMECKMVRFDSRSGNFFPTDLGRISSHFYIHHESILKYNELLHQNMSDEEVFHLLSVSKEFDQVQVREDEQNDLEKLLKNDCFVHVHGGTVHNFGKTNILMQAFLSRARILSPSLVSDSYYISQNVSRICRALFQICLKQGWTYMAAKMLSFCRMFERQMWNFETPLRQLQNMNFELAMKLEERRINLDDILEMEPGELGGLIKNERMGPQIYRLARRIPRLELHASVRPITRSVLMVRVVLKPEFDWSDHIHGSSQPFIIWVEDSTNEFIYHHEQYILSKKDHSQRENFELEFAIPISEPLPSQYYVRAFSEFWLGGDTVTTISFRHLILPEVYPPHTQLLNLSPVPVTALHNPRYEQLYSKSFSFFNPIQTQSFHVCYYSDENVLLGAPTGSGKTIVAELAMLRLFNEYPERKVVYIAPLKALARQRIEGWRKSVGKVLGKKVVELTGDFTPDLHALNVADILITTPEKWDGISRSWRSKSRDYVQKVGLVIIDEIHLLGQDRGPILEVIVSRMRFISMSTGSNIRIIGLSTALSNAQDLAIWLGISKLGFFNFAPSVRPVPLSVHISGFSGRHYCPRMATMNKPAYAAIMTYSPGKPVLIFVSSRRQTRLTALDLIYYAAADGNPKAFSRLSDVETEYLKNTVSDPNLRHTIEFGIGLHHAGLRDRDRMLVESLFEENKIQILVCTSTLAWGVNLPAHLVIIKGTEFFDAKEGRYVDLPITDVLQMMGRAGRPQFDNQGRACIFVHEPKKNFYRKFLYEPFPVESSLLNALHDHMNAEIVGGSINSISDAIDYLTWTFLFRRLVMNPSYYRGDYRETDLDGEIDSAKDDADLHNFLYQVVKDCIDDLDNSGLVEFQENSEHLSVKPTPLGRIASFYYLSYKTVGLFSEALNDTLTFPQVLDILCEATEYDELPVRHNEDNLNRELIPLMKWEIDELRVDSPHVKANILFQAHFSRLPLPISDYHTDLKSVLDQSIRILQAMIDMCAQAGWLSSCLKAINLLQMVIQGRWLSDSSLSNLPGFNDEIIRYLKSKGVLHLAQLLEISRSRSSLEKMFLDISSNFSNPRLFETLSSLPLMNLSFSYESPEVSLDTEIEIEVKFERINSKKTLKAYAPFWSRIKEEGWFIIIGLQSTDEILSFKRQRIPLCRSSTKVTIFPPEAPGEYVFTFYLMSDSYIGLDQQYDLTFKINDS